MALAIAILSTNLFILSIAVNIMQSIQISKLEKLNTKIKTLEEENQFKEEVLQTLEVTDLDFEKRTFKVLANKTKWFGVSGTNG